MAISRNSLGAKTYTYYDMLSRVIKASEITSDGTRSMQTVYDNLDRISKKSEPYFEGSNADTQWHYYTYDNLNRITQESFLGDITTYSYDSLTTIVTQHAGTDESRTTSRIYNATGDILKIEDPSGEIIYNYKYIGKPDTIKSDNVKTIITYDNKGRRTSITDPSAGRTTFEYDNQNCLISQQDANGATTVFNYDKYGREMHRTITNNITNETATITNKYNDEHGLLDSTIINGQESNNVMTSYLYDDAGRITSKSTHIDGKRLITNYVYGKYGRINTKTYPNGFTIEYGYNDYGEMSNITDMHGSNIWQKGTRNACGQYMSSKLGDNMVINRVYDNWGNITNSVFKRLIKTLDERIYVYTGADHLMTYRGNTAQTRALRITGGGTTQSDIGKKWYESFTYDTERRLTRSVFNFDNNSVIGDTLEYATNGNLMYKNDIGDLYYNENKPYQIESIIPSETLIEEGVENKFHNQYITHTPFHRVKSISQQNASLNLPEQAHFIYNSNLDRVKMSIVRGENTIREKYYADDYEEIRDNTNGNSFGNTTTICYIRTPEGLQSAFKSDSFTAVGTLYYFITDHTGSITAVISEQGEVLQRYLYDAWGNRRVVSDSTYYNYNAETPTLPLFDRGYIGEDHLDMFGLINLNARLYDPVLGRFLSPDPYVQAPDNLQNFNRYAYGLNNPLIYVDPDGEFFWVPMVIGAIIGTYMGGVIANDGEYNLAKWDYQSGRTWGYMLGGAVVGAAAGYAGWIVGVSGIPMANTLGIMASSFVNSVGTFIYTGGRTDVSVSFGVASYNFSRNEWGYLGKDGNKWYEDLGYGLGALANLSDILAGFKPGEVTLRTENDPDYIFYGKLKDPIGHSQITKGNDVLIDWGPDELKSSTWKLIRGTNSYEQGKLIPNLKSGSFWDPIDVKGVNVNRMLRFSNYLNKSGKYNLLYNNCVSMTSRALNMSGVFNIGIHPYLLHFQMYLRSIGIRPILYSHFLFNN
jgi:RHS repeat-associated protein